MSNKKPTISVVIPVFRRKNLAKSAITSVLAQVDYKYQDTEIIICDDEKEAAKASNNSRFYKGISGNIRYLQNKFYKGPGGNRQTGLSVARGKYVIFLDSDDRLDPNYFKNVSKAFNSRRVIGAICFSKSIFEKRFSIKRRLRLLPLILIRDTSLLLEYVFNNKNILKSSFYLCQMSHLVFLRKAIKGLKFNNDYGFGGEDWDFVIQALNKGSIQILPHKWLFFKYSNNSFINTQDSILKKWTSYTKLINKLTPDFKEFPFYNLFLLYIKFYGKNRNGKLMSKEGSNKFWNESAKETVTPIKHFLADYSIRVRKSQFLLFNKYLRPNRLSRVLDVGVTSDETLKDSNIFERLYPFKNNLTAATIENVNRFRKIYPQVKTVKIQPHKYLPFRKSKFDYVVSWATLEHTGGYKSQEFFLNELLRTGKKIFVTTPYRGCPYEPHTGLPFLQWLPLPLFRKICGLLGMKYWSWEDNLNPLYLRDIKAMSLSRKLNVEIFYTFNLIPSHIIIYG